MNEQLLADGFRAVVADEPPLGFDPDQVIDRAIRQRRRRRIVWIAASATMIEAAVVWALIGAPGGGDDGVRVAGPASNTVAPPPPLPLPPNRTVTITGFERILTRNQPLVMQPEVVELRIEDVLARNPDGDSGVVRLKNGDAVLLQLNLENFREYDLHFTDPVRTGPAAVTLDVTCTTVSTGCANVSMTVSGFAVERDR